MLRHEWRQVLRRGSRALALGLAILVASTGFTVLTASSRAAQLQTLGVVRRQPPVPYDILVRPSGSRLPLERQQRLVQPGFLSGIHGGISLGQWHSIQHISGVSVAAPVAMVGYIFPNLVLPVSTTGAWSKHGDSLARVDVTWRGDNGLTRTVATPDFALITSHRLTFNQGGESTAGSFYWTDRHGHQHQMCPDPLPSVTDGRPERKLSTVTCFSRTGGGADRVLREWASRHLQGVLVNYPLPYVVAAVDPASEDRLFGLDHARTSGQPLLGAGLSYPPSVDGRGAPMLLSDQPTTTETATIRLSIVNRAGLHRADANATGQQLRGFPARTRGVYTVTAAHMNKLLLHQFRTAKPVPSNYPTRQLPGEVTRLAQVSLPTIQPRGVRGLIDLSKVPAPFATTLSQGQQFQAPDSSDPAARQVVTSAKTPELSGTAPTPATLYLRGTFDPRRLPGLQTLANSVLGGYATAPTFGATPATRRLLKGRALQPSANITGFVQPPPMMITSLAALPQLTQGWDPTTETAPISAIRVRVAGVHGIDPLSRQRVRLAAQRIQQHTGLAVDIVTGSSPTKEQLRLPAGTHGRPALDLFQWWIKKGVAVAIITALDKKSLVLFFLVLLVSALSVANSAVSSVRARRTELGVLACVGWRRRDLFTSVLTQLGVIATLAGLTSVALAYGIGHIIDVPVSPARALLGLPAALLVALIAGLIPAWLASRSTPLDAVRPVVNEPRRTHSPVTVTGLSRANLGRTKARTLLAAVGLMVAVVVFTMLLAITLAFQGAVVGSILGDAVAIQARGADYAATAAILLLACLGVANVMYVNIRERGPELATLRAVGWTETHLDRLITTEGALLGLLGATPGAVLGLAGARLLTGSMSAGVIGGALIAFTVAVALAATAAYATTRSIRRLSTTLLLTE